MKILIPLIIAISVAAGCGSSEAGPSSQEAGLRAKLTNPEIDYEAVPQAQRAQVLAMMKANGGAKKAAELEKKWGMSK